MSICETCKFYHICKGRLYKTDSECARYKSVYSPQKRKELQLRKFEKELLKRKKIFELKENYRKRINMIGNNFKIITLCGSTKFKKEFEEIYKKLSLEGNIVLTVACFGHVDSPEVFKIPGLKDMLDEMHKEKIRMSDGIFVINPNNYIGNSTKNEIEYAKSLNKDIQYLEDPITKE